MARLSDEKVKEREAFLKDYIKKNPGVGSEKLISLSREKFNVGISWDKLKRLRCKMRMDSPKARLSVRQSRSAQRRGQSARETFGPRTPRSVFPVHVMAAAETLAAWGDGLGYVSIKVVHENGKVVGLFGDEVRVETVDLSKTLNKNGERTDG